MHNKLSSLSAPTTTMDLDRDEDTLSFASLLQPNTPNKPHRPKQLSAGPSLEFRQPTNPPPSSPADLLFANGTILPQNSFPVYQNGLGSRRRCLRQGNGRRSADSVTKRVSFRDDVAMPKRSVSSPLPDVVVGATTDMKFKRKAEKNRGLLGSIIFACRECRAVEPSKRVGNVVN